MAQYFPVAEQGAIFHQALQLRGDFARDAKFCRDLVAGVKAQAAAGRVIAALQLADTIDDSTVRAAALVALAEQLSGTEQDAVLQLAFELMQKRLYVSAEKQAADLVAVIKAQVAAGHVESALEMTNAIWGIKMRARALATVAEHLPPSEQAAVLRDALQLAKTIDNTKDRTEALATVVKALAAAGHVTEALQLATTIDDTQDRTEALATVVHYILLKSPSALYLLWCNALHSLAQRGRKVFLSDLAVLAPLIDAFGGQTALVEVADSIRDVCRWFP